MCVVAVLCPWCTVNAYMWQNEHYCIQIVANWVHDGIVNISCCDSRALYFVFVNELNEAVLAVFNVQSREVKTVFCTLTPICMCYKRINEVNIYIYGYTLNCHA